MKELIEFHAFRLLKAVAGMLPYRIAGKTGAMLGSLVFRCTPIRKKVTLDNLSHAFPDRTPAERRRIAAGAFKNYGSALVEMLWSGNQSAETLMKTVRVNAGGLPERRLLDPNGLIILSGHFGCWEFIMQGVRLHLDRPFTTIVHRQRNRRVDAVIDRIRTRFGNTTIPMGHGSARESLKVLRKGGVLAALGDQSGPKESIYVTFFGRPASAHRGVAALALKNRSSLVMVFMVRGGQGIYDAVFEELPFDDLREYNEENIRELTQRHTSVLEKYIRMYPDHWLWMHKRWKHTEYYQSRQTAEAEA